MRVPPGLPRLPGVAVLVGVRRRTRSSALCGRAGVTRLIGTPRRAGATRRALLAGVTLLPRVTLLPGMGLLPGMTRAGEGRLTPWRTLARVALARVALARVALAGVAARREALPRLPWTRRSVGSGPALMSGLRRVRPLARPPLTGVLLPGTARPTLGRTGRRVPGLAGRGTGAGAERLRRRSWGRVPVGVHLRQLTRPRVDRLAPVVVILVRRAGRQGNPWPDGAAIPGPRRRSTPFVAVAIGAEATRSLASIGHVGVTFVGKGRVDGRRRPVHSPGLVIARLRMEGNGVGFVAATMPQPGSTIVTSFVRTFLAIAASGFRRYSTYRVATVAACVTNSMFGFLRTYALLAVAAGTAGLAAGYTRPQLASYVWLGQGLIGVVLFWSWTELADRVRTGDVITDLQRPIHPVTSYLATDVGRAAHAAVSRFVVPVAVGALAFDLYVPHRWTTYPLFMISVGLAVVVSFACRYVVNAAAYWLLDARGVLITWTLLASVLSGLYFPLNFLPDWLATALWFGTPFPSLLQTPLDVAVERYPLPRQLGYVAVQLGWAVGALLLARLVQRRAEYRLVIQGG